MNRRQFLKTIAVSSAALGLNGGALSLSGEDAGDLDYHR